MVYLSLFIFLSIYQINQYLDLYKDLLRVVSSLVSLVNRLSIFGRSYFFFLGCERGCFVL